MHAFEQATIFHWTNVENEINTYTLVQLIVAHFKASVITTERFLGINLMRYVNIHMIHASIP